MLIANHNKIGFDDAHDHYDFSFKNFGVGNAFDLQIESFHREGSRVYTPVSIIGINAATTINNKSVDKDAKGVRFKISYRDYADNLYTRDFFYEFESGIDRGSYVRYLKPPNLNTDKFYLLTSNKTEVIIKTLII